MDQQEIKTFKLFEALDENGGQSQRELARKLEISLGLVNSLLKRIVKRGFFRVVNADKSRLKYVLTPKGISKKVSLTYNYLLHSILYYRDIRLQVGQLFEMLANDEVKNIIFVGASELAEIAYIILHEFDFELVGIVDNEKAGKKFLGMNVWESHMLCKTDYDALIITLLDSDSEILETLANLGVQKKKIYTIPYGL